MTYTATFLCHIQRETIRIKLFMTTDIVQETILYTLTQYSSIIVVVTVCRRCTVLAAVYDSSLVSNTLNV